ncbi:MAG: ComEC/Rec2 family competence protein [Gammaproteobacteria bacterium]
MDAKMPLLAATFLAGIYTLYLCPQLPPGTLLFTGLPLAIGVRHSSFPKWPCWFVVGFACAWLNAASRLTERLPENLSGKDFELTMTIGSIPETSGIRARFVAIVTDKTDSFELPSRLLLNWYNAPANLHAGDSWRVVARLRSPRGFMNPGGFDYERWLFSRNIGATGYIRKSAATRKLEHNAGMASLRQVVTFDLLRHFPGDSGALLAALSTGYRAAVTKEVWRTLDRTGTRHLLAISGMHVGMAALLGFLAGSFFWRHGPGWLRILPKQVFSTAFSLLPAVMYAAMAGFSVPTQRALCAVVGATTALLIRRGTNGFQLLAWAVLAVLLYDPAAVLETAFWLSFTVSLLLVCLAAGRGARSYWSLVTIQILLFPVLVPLTAMHFQQISWVSPFANLLAIPIFTLFLIPLVLVGLLINFFDADAALGIFSVADTIIRIVYLGLERVASYDWAFQAINPGRVALLLTAPFAIVWVMPRSFPGRGTALVLLAPLFAGTSDQS